MAGDGSLCDGQFPVETYQTLGSHAPALVSDLSCSAVYFIPNIPVHKTGPQLLFLDYYNTKGGLQVLSPLRCDHCQSHLQKTQVQHGTFRFLFPILENNSKSQQSIPQTFSSQVSFPFSQTPWTQATLDNLGFTIKS